jgi:hypothetical protein
MDVVVWLRSLGLGKYEAVFRDNDIDETVLPSLTHENLKELGVASFGHRVKLLDAIAALRSDASVQTPSIPVGSARPTTVTATVTPVTEAIGERRHVTVMFCDLVGSTSISAGLDAEDWRDLVGAYLDAASAAVAEMGGHVAKKLGDGLMVLFGYPVAQENDAERAARSALSIQRALAEVNRKNAGSGKPALNAPAAHSRPRPDCDFARHSRAAPRADQASGRATASTSAERSSDRRPALPHHNSTPPSQRLWGAGNQCGCGARTSLNRAG